MKNQLIQYAEYNHWANERLFSHCVQNCSPDDFEKEVNSSFKSIKKTWLHIWGAESIWLQRLKGNSPSGWKWSDHTGNMEELKKDLLDNSKDFSDYLSSCSEQFFLTPFEYSTIDGTLYKNFIWEAVLHCMNHSTFHRGQIVTLLRQSGSSKFEPMDFVVHARQLNSV
ncbi:MAG: hypothetical protein DWQ44_01490 [Bacteroidetes bacterium]|nr:MAG: hypothetical protein DWQ33_05220 [Bacteroidota bacterium]REK04653.1 MAG: hypothetical protein DWQ39_05380 [Bacteroidota bacterium]REK36128.1 MAG: hypothetical protein DWQ44_01490 [Bacteroidota bacterium]REK51501.1 MAG: hypothetical protein DWQ48_01345 [Bacteroidota bacterium]